MSKFILFSLLWWLTGSPFVSIFILLLIFYFLDRRYVGMFPSLMKPVQTARREARIKQELRVNPHHTGNKLELARIMIEKHQFQKALPYILEVHEKIQDSPEVIYLLGLCYLKTGEAGKGEELILLALGENPMLKYGEPYLELVEWFSKNDVEKAFHYLEQVRNIQSSSVETYYRLGSLYTKLGRPEESKSAFHEALEIYRSLPKYMRRKQRKWAILSQLKK